MNKLDARQSGSPENNASAAVMGPGGDGAADKITFFGDDIEGGGSAEVDDDGGPP